MRKSEGTKKINKMRKVIFSGMLATSLMLSSANVCFAGAADKPAVQSTVTESGETLQEVLDRGWTLQYYALGNGNAVCYMKRLFEGTVEIAGTNGEKKAPAWIMVHVDPKTEKLGFQLSIDGENFLDYGEENQVTGLAVHSSCLEFEFNPAYGEKILYPDETTTKWTITDLRMISGEVYLGIGVVDNTYGDLIYRFDLDHNDDSFRTMHDKLADL